MDTSLKNSSMTLVKYKKDIDWSQITGKLPVKKRDPRSKQARMEMWNYMDMNGNGYLSLAEIDKGMRDVLQSDMLFDAKPAIMRAF